MSPGRRSINRVGADLRWPDALGHGALGYYMIRRVVAEEFEFDKGPVEEAFFGTSCLLHEISPAELANQPPDGTLPLRKWASARTVSRAPLRAAL